MFKNIHTYIESRVGYEGDPVIEENLKCRQGGKSTNALTTTTPLAPNRNKNATLL